jgi:hypothetical protein
LPKVKGPEKKSLPALRQGNDEDAEIYCLPMEVFYDLDGQFPIRVGWNAFNSQIVDLNDCKREFEKTHEAASRRVIRRIMAT